MAVGMVAEMAGEWDALLVALRVELKVVLMVGW